MNILKKFALAWSIPSYGEPTKVEEHQFNSLEEALGIKFPEDYRTSILETGLPSGTLDLWEWIDAKESSFNWKFWESRPLLWHLNSFYSPDEILSALEWQNAGLPKNLIPFAGDSMGNQFCFSQEDLSNEKRVMAPVYH
ncbi:MAG: SMI1/KNR4 family protein [Pseudomonadota bacterium]